MGTTSTPLLAPLDRLQRAGILQFRSGRYDADTAVFAAAARLDATRRRETEPTPESLGATADQAAVLRNFLSGGRLTHLPATRARRLVILDFLAGRFSPGRRYPEKEVNRILAQFHEDVATLRRYLVDEGLMARDHGLYWRVGGTTEAG